jgi:hypothetical protein
MTTEKSIRPLLDALETVLCEAHDSAAQAVSAMAQGHRNQAIGILLDLEQRLPAAQALYTAALTMHRLNRLPRKGGAQ